MKSPYRLRRIRLLRQGKRFYANLPTDGDVVMQLSEQFKRSLEAEVRRLMEINVLSDADISQIMQQAGIRGKGFMVTRSALRRFGVNGDSSNLRRTLRTQGGSVLSSDTIDLVVQLAEKAQRAWLAANPGPGFRGRASVERGQEVMSDDKINLVVGHFNFAPRVRDQVITALRRFALHGSLATLRGMLAQVIDDPGIVGQVVQRAQQYQRAYHASPRGSGLQEQMLRWRTGMPGTWSSKIGKTEYTVAQTPSGYVATIAFKGRQTYRQTFPSLQAAQQALDRKATEDAEQWSARMRSY